MSCDKPVVFPRLIDNRPALPRVDVKIGDYADMRAHMLGLIDSAPALKAWTHRGADDPGIALVEATAVVGDILATYQDDYANESLLRTAQLDDSVAGLVRLLGYRPAPGLGGRARFAIAVKGDVPVTVPAGLALDAQLEGADKPATFETAAELSAVPALSAFHLHRPRRVPPVANGMDTFQVRGDATLKPGDKLMVGLATGPAANRAFDHTQVLEVEKVWDAYGIRYVKTKGQLESLARSLIGSAALSVAPSVSLLSAASAASLASVSAAASVASVSATSASALSAASAVSAVPAASSLSAASAFSAVAAAPAASALSASVSPFTATLAVSPMLAGLAVPLVATTPSLVAWKLGGEFHHFGHAAPPTRVVVDSQGRATQVAVSYQRALAVRDSGEPDPSLGPTQLPLDGQVRDVAAGIDVLVVANLQSGSRVRKRLLQRRVRQVDPAAMTWGSASGPATVLTLDADLAITEGSVALASADIRNLAVHAVQGAAFELAAAPVPTSAASGSTLDFYGSAADAQALLSRTLLFLERGGPAAALVQRVRRQTSGEPRFEITLDRTFDYRDYPHDDPQVTVHGNLVDATEGKTQPEAALGDGDARAAWQTFALPKAPLTYLLDAAASPPQIPEIDVRVDGVLWQRTESFYDSGPTDAHYIVRETPDGKSFVQFGDGVNGARLPSGKGNVTVGWRTGQGSRGPLAVGMSVSAKPRFAGFDKAFLPEPVTGGAAPEPASSVRRAAPATMASLGRIVSLADCESEAQTLPGVLKARAAWTLVDGAPVLTLTVLTDGLDTADRVALEGALRTAFATRGPARFALRLRLGNRQFVHVALRVGYDQRLRTDDLLAAVRRALGTSPDAVAADDEPTGGLFDWHERQFGQDVHGSQVVGRVQNVPGVRWVELQVLAARTPVRLFATLASPQALPAVQRRLRCPGTSLLALGDADLDLEWVATP